MLKFRRQFFNAFSTFFRCGIKMLKYRRRINVEISRSVKISTLFFRQPSKYSYVFQHFFECRFNIESTSKSPLGILIKNFRKKWPLHFDIQHIKQSKIIGNFIFNSMRNTCRLVKREYLFFHFVNQSERV